MDLPLTTYSHNRPNVAGPERFNNRLEKIIEVEPLRGAIELDSEPSQLIGHRSNELNNRRLKAGKCGAEHMYGLRNI